MPQATRGTYRYVRGPSSARKLARFETKPSSYTRSGSRDTGAGYERLRSYEDLPNKPGGKRSVYVSLHRLLAVAWALPEEVDDDATAAEIVPHLNGRDIHHQNGVPWDNREENLKALDHGEHSVVTNTPSESDVRAWYEDDKRRARGDAPADPSELCNGDGCDAEPKATVAGVGYCLDCATDVAQREGEPVEVGT